MDEENKKGKDLAPQRGGEIIQTESAMFYSAPLPPASEFAKYENVLPGSADRIIKLAENQNRHRRFIENIVVIVDSIKSITGLIFALVIVLAGLASSVYLIIQDKPIGGFVTLITPLGTIAVAFLGQKLFKTDKEEK